MRVAINGFGRIGRGLLKKLLSIRNIDVVAINDIHEPKVLAHLFKYDSIHGVFSNTVSYHNSTLNIGSDISIDMLRCADLSEIPWKQYAIDMVFECSGAYNTREQLQKHLKQGAKKVILSAPPKSEEEYIKTIVMGVNQDTLTAKDSIVSNASCTTHSAAPLIKGMMDICSVKNIYITTVHSYTNDQSLHDVPHKDYRRARSAPNSIIPTTTGASKVLSYLFKDVNIGGCGIRVPVSNGSLTDITCAIDNNISVDEINAHFLQLSENGYLKHIVKYEMEPIVSRDILGLGYSSIFDAGLTSIVGNMVKIVGWYDNEMGYVSRLIDLLKYMNRYAY